MLHMATGNKSMLLYGVLLYRDLTVFSRICLLGRFKSWSRTIKKNIEIFILILWSVNLSSNIAITRVYQFIKRVFKFYRNVFFFHNKCLFYVKFYGDFK